MITYNDAAHAVLRAHKAAQQPQVHSDDPPYARQYHPVSHDRLSLSKANSYIENDNFIVVDRDRCPIGAVSEAGEVTLL